MTFTIQIIVGYAIAAAVSAHVNMAIEATDWLNGWTYFWWAASVSVLMGIKAAVGYALVKRAAAKMKRW